MIVVAAIILKPVKGEISKLLFTMLSGEDPIIKAKEAMIKYNIQRETIEVIVTYPMVIDFT